MTIEQVLIAMNVTIDTDARAYASWLVKVFDVLTSQNKFIVSAEKTDVSADFKMKDKDKNEMSAELINVITTTGNYKFVIPTANAFYNEVCKLVGLPYQEPQVEPVTITKSIVLPKIVLEAIKKAAKFTSNDDLRPAMTCVCLNFENNALEVVSTNAHYIFISELIPCKSGKKKVQLLIDKAHVKKLSLLKHKEDTLTVDFISENKAIIAGVMVQLPEEGYHRFPDYKVVVAKYEQKIRFDKKAFELNVKRVIPMANKSTCQVNFCMNGNIKMSTQDVDFSFESGVYMDHKGKDFVDTTIAFNGKFILTSLSIFKDKEVELYTEGRPDRMGIITNGKDRVGIMPLMLNN